MTSKSLPVIPGRDKNVAGPGGDASKCDGCVNRRSVLKLAMAGSTLAAFPGACLSGDPPYLLGTGGSDSGGASTGGVGGGGGGGGTTLPPPCTRLAVENAGSIAVGTLTRVLAGNTGVILGRDAAGFYAMQAFCPHAGFSLSVNMLQDSTGPISCILHGSQFGNNGELLRGPAGGPLSHYRLEVGTDGALSVCPDTVPSGTRTPLP